MDKKDEELKDEELKDEELKDKKRKRDCKILFSLKCVLFVS